jgi:hypothetical protein
MRTHRLRSYMLSGMPSGLTLGSLAATLLAAGCGSGSDASTITLLGLLPPRATAQVILAPTYSGIMPITLIERFPSGGMAKLKIPEPLPQGITGELRAGVGIFDSQRCLLSYGSTPGYVGTPFTIPLVALPAPDCRSRVVLLSQVAPAAPRGSDALTLYGYGFQLGARAFINGQPAARTTFVTPSELSIQAATTLPTGRLTVRVMNPDNNEDSRDDLVTVSN